MFTEGGRFFLTTTWGWNVLDTLIVVISAVEVGLDLQTDSGTTNFGYVRMIRIARTVRILRIVRIMKYFRSLRILIYSVLNTLRSLMWTLLLLVIILYVFGLIFTQSTTQYRLDEMAKSNEASSSNQLLCRYFGTLFRSIFTLFKCITGGLSWEQAVDPLSITHPLMVVFFLVYIAFTYFAVLNVVTGVFCQTAIESANADQDMVIQAQVAMKNQYIKKLEKLFRSIDIHDTGLLTFNEFEDAMKEEWLQAYFASMDITVDEAFSLFKLLDIDDTRVINIEAFVTGCLRLRGSAKSIDIAMMMYESRWTMQRFMHLMKTFHVQFEQLQQQLLGSGAPSASGSPCQSPRKVAPRPSFCRNPSALRVNTSMCSQPDVLKRGVLDDDNCFPEPVDDGNNPEPTDDTYTI